jgi:hypothetical protein
MRIMINYTKLFLPLTLLLLASSCFGQYYYFDDKHYDNDIIVEVGGGFGGMNCLTDLGGSKSKGGLYINDINWKNTKASGSFYVGVMFRQTAGLRLEATFGAVEAYDSILKGATGNALFRYNRNLNFRSTISEIALIGEVHPLMFFERDFKLPVSPYFAAGLGYFSFNPQANINGRYIDLQPLRTEGQGFKEYPGRSVYHRSQVNVPVGVGLKYDISSLFNVRVEFMHRFLFTDYLDDVSTTFIDPALFQKYLSSTNAGYANALYSSGVAAPGATRGSPKVKDAYMTFSLKLALSLGREVR